jgi:hypothetical protein
MFAENGAFEMPYLESLGIPWRYEGREKVEGFLGSFGNSTQTWTSTM